MVTASSSRSSGSHRSSPAVKDKRASAPVQDEPEPDTDKMGVDQEGEQQGDHGDQAEAVADDAGEEDEDEEEEEYEIESIISHEIGHFEAGNTAYLVSWKGYGPEDNSWVAEEDAENAREMLDEYWKKTPRANQPRKLAAVKGRKSAQVAASASSSVSSTKRSSNAAAAAASLRAYATSSSRRGRNSRAAAAPETETEEPESTELEVMDVQDAEEEEEKEEVDEAEQRKRRKYERIVDWEPIVTSVETMERDESDGRLIVFINFKNGDQLAFESRLCNQRCPQKMLEFYEAHLRFKTPSPANRAKKATENGDP